MPGRSHRAESIIRRFILFTVQIGTPMTSTDTLHPAPAAAPKKGKGRKIAVIAGVGATLLIGVLIGKAGGSSTAAAAPTPVPVTITKTVQAAPVTVQAPPVTVQAAAPAPVTVTVTAPPPAPETVTAAAAAPAAPAAGKAPGDPKKNGNYLIGSQIEGGTWQCDNPSSLPYWSVKSETNELLDNGIESIATIQEGFKAELSGCNSVWTKV
jgi:hypothetical protein